MMLMILKRKLGTKIQTYLIYRILLERSRKFLRN